MNQNQRRELREDGCRAQQKKAAQMRVTGLGGEQGRIHLADSNKAPPQRVCDKMPHLHRRGNLYHASLNFLRAEDCPVVFIDNSNKQGA